MLFTVLHHPMVQRDTKSHLEKNIRSFSGDQVVGRQSLHTTRSIAQIFVGGCSMSILSV